MTAAELTAISRHPWSLGAGSITGSRFICGLDGTVQRMFAASQLPMWSVKTMRMKSKASQVD
jgi:hypothetical protein